MKVAERAAFPRAWSVTKLTREEIIVIIGLGESGGIKFELGEMFLRYLEKRFGV
jgi:hypothetical protein